MSTRRGFFGWVAAGLAGLAGSLGLAGSPGLAEGVKKFRTLTLTVRVYKEAMRALADFKGITEKEAMRQIAEVALAGADVEMTKWISNNKMKDVGTT